MLRLRQTWCWTAFPEAVLSDLAGLQFGNCKKIALAQDRVDMPGFLVLKAETGLPRARRFLAPSAPDIHHAIILIPACIRHPRVCEED